MSSLVRYVIWFAWSLARIAANDPTLSAVEFGERGIGDKGAEGLVAVLQGNTVVTYLGLSANRISAALVRALVNVLEDSTSITSIDLSGNSIGAEGVRALARFLLNNSILSCLNLSNCGISVVSVRALVEALPNNSSLTRLDLGGNYISDEGARLLVRALFVNSFITEIYLQHNGISYELERLVEELVRINRGAANPQEALGLKVEWLINLDDDDACLLGFKEGGAKEKAVSLALHNLDCFAETDQRQELFGRLLGVPEHGVDVAKSVRVARGRTLYWYAVDCGAASGVLLTIIRAHPSLCTCKDVRHRLYPFMLLATMEEAGAEDVMELLLLNPNLVEDGIPDEH